MVKLSEASKGLTKMLIVHKEKYETIKYIIANIILILLIAQFDRSFIFSNYALYVFPVLIFIFLLKDYLSKSTFLFLILIFIGSHFTFSNEYGGTFTIVSFFVIVFYWLRRKQIKEIIVDDKGISLILFILIISSVLGWIFKAKLNLMNFPLSIICFFSLLITYQISNSIIWTPNRLKILILIICIIAVYALFTAIINIVFKIPFHSHLWYSYPNLSVPEGTFFIGFLERPTTALGAMYSSFLLPIFLGLKEIKTTRNKKRLIYIGLFSSILVCVVGFSKSHTIVLICALIFILFFYSSKLININKIFQKAFILFLTAFIIYLGTNSFFNYNFILHRFQQQPELVTNLLNDPLTAKGTSREESFSMAIESLQRENWFVGYGYTNGHLNRTAWLGPLVNETAKYDFHNLYFSLPQVFGWIGALAYIGFFIVTINRIRKIVNDKNLDRPYRIIGISFLMLFVVHLATEYSICALSSPNYMMVLFIWLGLANSYYYNYKRGLFYKTFWV